MIIDLSRRRAERALLLFAPHETRPNRATSMSAMHMQVSDINALTSTGLAVFEKRSNGGAYVILTKSGVQRLDGMLREAGFR